MSRRAVVLALLVLVVAPSCNRSSPRNPAIDALPTVGGSMEFDLVHRRVEIDFFALPPAKPVELAGSCAGMPLTRSRAGMTGVMVTANDASFVVECTITSPSGAPATVRLDLGDLNHSLTCADDACVVTQHALGVHVTTSTNIQEIELLVART